MWFIFLQPLDPCEFGNTTSAFAAGQSNSEQAFGYYLSDNIRNGYLYLSAILTINVENVSLVYKAYTFFNVESYGTTIIVVSAIIIIITLIIMNCFSSLFVHSCWKSSNDEDSENLTCHLSPVALCNTPW